MPDFGNGKNAQVAIWSEIVWAGAKGLLFAAIVIGPLGWLFMSHIKEIHALAERG